MKSPEIYSIQFRAMFADLSGSETFKEILVSTKLMIIWFINS